MRDWLRRPQTWIELFALANLLALAPDIGLAHGMNRFAEATEWIPLAVSLVAPPVLGVALAAQRRGDQVAWRRLGMVVGWIAITTGIAGLVLHLEGWFFQHWTLASLVYAAPFAAPLAYTGIGLLLVMNRMVEGASEEWARWIVLLALGGFFGNFVFSLTDHAQNGFFRAVEWTPVVSSALATGLLVPPLFERPARGYLRLAGWILGLQAAVGVAGFVLHMSADLYAPGGTLLQRAIHGAPVFVPLLFPDLVVLACIGLVVLARSGEHRADS